MLSMLIYFTVPCITMAGGEGSSIDLYRPVVVPFHLITNFQTVTCAAPITVDIEYTRGKEIVVKKGRTGQGAICIGRIPLMLRCDRCAWRYLQGYTPAALPGQRCAVLAVKAGRQSIGIKMRLNIK